MASKASDAHAQCAELAALTPPGWLQVIRTLLHLAQLQFVVSHFRVAFEHERQHDCAKQHLPNT